MAEIKTLLDDVIETELANLRTLPSGGVRGLSGKEVHGDIRIVISRNDNTKYYRPGALHKALRGDFSPSTLRKRETLSCLSSADNGQKTCKK